MKFSKRKEIIITLTMIIQEMLKIRIKGASKINVENMVTIVGSIALIIQGINPEIIMVDVTTVVK